MPLFWKTEMNTYTRKQLKPLLKEYLLKAKGIANGEPNTLTNESFAENESYYSILGRFINFTNDNLDTLFSDTEKKELEHLKYREAIWESFGCSIINRSRYKVGKIPLQNSLDKTGEKGSGS